MTDHETEFLTAMVALMVPVVTAVVGAIGILARDLYSQRSEVGRRKYALDDATRRVAFTAEWWKAKQALGSAADDQGARAIAQSWLEETTSLVSEALHPRRRPGTDRSVTRRILLAYPFQRWTARLLRVIYYLFLALWVSVVLVTPMENIEGIKVGDKVILVVFGIVVYGLPTFAIRAWAISIENRPAKQQASAQPSVPTGRAERSISPQPGWYPDPAGVPGQRYWDGQQWTAVAPALT
jgi:Protein of unknown function (DUF2510)